MPFDAKPSWRVLLKVDTITDSMDPDQVTRAYRLELVDDTTGASSVLELDAAAKLVRELAQRLELARRMERGPAPEAQPDVAPVAPAAPASSSRNRRPGWRPARRR